MDGLKFFVCVVASWASVLASAGDLGFRWRQGACLNAAGAQGLNPAFLGPCADLRGAVLDGKNMGGIDFKGSDFSKASAQNSNWNGSDLGFTNFYGAQLKNSEFRGALFRNANLNEADFSSCQMQGANFRLTQITGAHFNYANLDDADFRSTQILISDLADASWARARFNSLSRMGFSEADAAAKGMLKERTLNLLVVRAMGWSAESEREYGAFLSRLGYQYDIQVTVTAGANENFDGAQLAQGFDALILLDGGSPIGNLNPVAQRNIVDFVVRGGTFVHEGGLGLSEAARPKDFLGLKNLILFGAFNIIVPGELELVSEPENSASSKITEGFGKFPIQFNGTRAYNGALRGFGTSPSEVLLKNAKPVHGASEDMVAIRRMGQGRIVGLNFSFHFERDYGMWQNPDGPLFYSNIFHLGL